MSLFSKIFGDENQKILKKLQPQVDKINELEPKFEKFSNEELKNKTTEFKERLQKEETLEDLLPEAFAVVREAAKRTLQQRHFDVQLIGGIVLHQGKIAEMKTGEGKTLAATLAVYLNALEGKGAHIVTVNNYLAKRDTVWMGQIYYFLGLNVGCIGPDENYLYDPEYGGQEKEAEEKDEERDSVASFKVVDEYLRPCSKKEAYQADITYGTNDEFGFDYLRDNMAYNLEDRMQRGFNFAIVDEVDSILIDEARTPLIVSVPDTGDTQMYKDFARIVPYLKENVDFNLDEKMKSVNLTDEGIDKVENMLGRGGLYEKGEVRLLHHLEQALKAEFLFKRDKDYVVRNNRVIIIDEFTGRLLPGRRYSEGLHQAIEAKEGVDIQKESRTLAKITFQNFFRMYEKLAGMTGTAATSSEEFGKVYNLEVVVIPTHEPMIRQNLTDRIYSTEKAKFSAVVEEIKQRHEKGQPVLVGTRSVEKNEYLSKLLDREGIPHQVLNAKHHEQEGEIIAQAGRWGMVTIATNMAGRGVDIILGGNPPDENEAQKVREVEGLHVIGSERHEARRIDNQLRGRCGRQGDPGSSQFFVSLEDELPRVFGGENLKKIMDRFNLPEDAPIENKFVARAIENAQSKVEGHDFDVREHLLEYDGVLSKQRNKVYEKRDKLLRKSQNKEEFKKEVFKIVKSQIKEIVDFHTSSDYVSDWNLEEIFEEIKTIFPVSHDVHQHLISISKEPHSKAQELAYRIKEYLWELADQEFNRKEEELGDDFLETIKTVVLRILDLLWMEHLENMDHLRDSVQLRAYGQIDPLVAYRREGRILFQNLLYNFEKETARTIFRVQLTSEESSQSQSPGRSSQPSPSSRKLQEKAPSKKLGRNSLCPCGSGKKYKHCCWPKYGH